MTPDEQRRARQQRSLAKVALGMAEAVHPLLHLFGPRCGWACVGNRKARDFREAIMPGARR